MNGKVRDELDAVEGALPDDDKPEKEGILVNCLEKSPNRLAKDLISSINDSLQIVQHDSLQIVPHDSHKALQQYAKEAYSPQIKVSVKLKRNESDTLLPWKPCDKNYAPKIVTPATEATRYVENLLLGQSLQSCSREDTDQNSSSSPSHSSSSSTSEQLKENQITVYIRRKKCYATVTQGSLKSKKI